MAAASAGCIQKEGEGSSTEVVAEESSIAQDGNCSTRGNEIEDSSGDEEDEGCRYYTVEEPEGSL